MGWFATLFALFGAVTARASDPGDGGCDDLAVGAVYPAELTAHLEESAQFFLCGGSAGVFDRETCEWWVEPDADGTDRGTVAPETGSPVTWTAPAQLENCIATEFRLFAQCEDLSATSWATITLQCDDGDKSEIRERASGTEVSGGGCNSATTTGMGVLVLPLLAVGRRRPAVERRR